MSAENVVAAKYAKALLALALPAQQAGQVMEELALAASYFGSGDGQLLLSHPLMSPEKKLQGVKEVLAGKISALVLALFKLLLEKRRGRLLAAVAASYELEWRVQQKRRVAVVTSATPLTAEQVKRLQASLRAACQQEVDLQQVTDPGLQAGARVQMGDLVLDGTLQARLERLRRALSFEN